MFALLFIFVPLVTSQTPEEYEIQNNCKCVPFYRCRDSNPQCLDVLESPNPDSDDEVTGAFQFNAKLQLLEFTQKNNVDSEDVPDYDYEDIPIGPCGNSYVICCKDADVCTFSEALVATQQPPIEPKDPIDPVIDQCGIRNEDGVGVT